MSTTAGMYTDSLVSGNSKYVIQFIVEINFAHLTIRNAENEIDKMVNHLLQKGVTTEVIGRSTPEFSDPTEQGWKKLGSTDWLKRTLLKANTDDLDVEEVC